MFYDKLLFLCAERGINPTKAAEAVGMTGGHVAKWKKGSIPTDYTVAKFAKFFGVPASFFAEKDEEKTVTLESLKEDERALLHSYRTMSEQDKEFMREFIRRIKGVD